MIWLGYLATALFIIASLFQMIRSVKEGHSKGVSHGMIWLLITGFIIMCFYVPFHLGWDGVLMTAYIGQLLIWSVIGKYKYFPKQPTKICREDDDLRWP